MAVATAGQPESIVIVGGGAAGFAAAEMLRRRGWQGRLTMLSEDADAPCDRPNLSKDYLAGTAPEGWLPLRPDAFYEDNRIDLQLRTVATQIDVAARCVTTGDGRAFPFDRLLLATGAEPVRLPISGADQAHVFTLRSLADSRAIIARAEGATSAVVLGSGFIGLEVAAALGTRGLAVHVVSLDARPLERVLGPELGDFIRRLHEDHGESFHMGDSIASIGPQSLVLSDGTELAADLVIIGAGVRPRLALAEEAGLAIDRGILVDEYLETSQSGIFAAGDVARWPGGAGGATARVEHWVVAERQGQVAAENMLGARTPFRDVPFFWSAHHDVTIRYAGHAQSWDAIEIDGDIGARNCLVRYRKGGTTLAIASIGRDTQALEQARMLRLADRVQARA
jgi:NADPH-dependent 2,4-dienoyl-CoA reductase/sulfur reductase-like enzyme